MLLAIASAFSRNKRWSLVKVRMSEIKVNYIRFMYSMTKRCRFSTFVRLHDLNAVDAASTACSNSLLVVCGTRESKVWVDWRMQVLRKERRIGGTTYRIKYVDPMRRFALKEFTPDEIFGCASSCTGTFPGG